MNLFLIGMPGSGKSSVGLILSDRLGLQFIDADDEIEKINHLSISEIFRTKGEPFFRQEEYTFLNLWDKDQCVIATGGGMPCTDINIKIMKNKGRVIYLECPVNVIVERLQNQELSKRPKFSNTSKKSLRQIVDDLLKNRNHYYKQADFVVNGQQSISNIVNLIEHNLSR